MSRVPRASWESKFAAWLLALLGAGMLALAAGIGVMVVREWSNPYARDGMLVVALLLVSGLSLVVVGKRLDRPSARVPEPRGFEVTRRASPETHQPLGSPIRERRDY
jgi:hypothetical protein